MLSLLEQLFKTALPVARPPQSPDIVFRRGLRDRGTSPLLPPKLNDAGARDLDTFSPCVWSLSRCRLSKASGDGEKVEWGQSVLVITRTDCINGGNSPCGAGTDRETRNMETRQEIEQGGV
jgi:hypothetical protein